MLRARMTPPNRPAVEAPANISGASSKTSGPSSAPPTENGNAPSKKSTRITAEAKLALRDYFSGAGYGRDTRMPGNNTDPGLDAIIERHGLSRDKAARQLRAWKAITFENANEGGPIPGAPVGVPDPGPRGNDAAGRGVGVVQERGGFGPAAAIPPARAQSAGLNDALDQDAAARILAGIREAEDEMVIDGEDDAAECDDEDSRGEDETEGNGEAEDDEMEDDEDNEAGEDEIADAGEDEADEYCADDSNDLNRPNGAPASVGRPICPMCNRELSFEFDVTLPSQSQFPPASEIYDQLRHHCFTEHREQENYCTTIYEVAITDDFIEKMAPISLIEGHNTNDSFGAISSLVLVTSYLDDGWQDFCPEDKELDHPSLCAMHFSSWAAHFIANADRTIKKVLSVLKSSARTIRVRWRGLMPTGIQEIKIKRLVVGIIMALKNKFVELRIDSSQDTHSDLHDRIRDMVPQTLSAVMPVFIEGIRGEFIQRFSRMLVARLKSIPDLHR